MVITVILKPYLKKAEREFYYFDEGLFKSLGEMFIVNTMLWGGQNSDQYSIRNHTFSFLGFNHSKYRRNQKRERGISGKGA